MNQLRLDKLFSQKLKKTNPELYEEALSEITKKYKSYIGRIAA